MNRMRPLCMFFLIMTGYILLAYLIFPVEDNIWKVPDYYLAISVLTSSAFVILYERWQKRRKPKHLPNEPLVISDELLEPAASTVITTGQASISMIQRRLGVSYTRGAELMDLLEQVGVVSPLDKKNSRKILLTREQYRRYKPSLFTLSNVRASTVEDELACVDAMEGHDFEHWGADLLRDLGFTKVEVTRGSGDQGVDILAEKDGIRYAVQCKRYHSPLGNKPVQEVHAGKEMYQCQIGAVMTNRYFTPSGREIAEKTGVLLWDRDWLRDAINRRQIG